MTIQAPTASSVQAYNASDVQARIGGADPTGTVPPGSIALGYAAAAVVATDTYNPCPPTGAVAQDAIDEVLGGTGGYTIESYVPGGRGAEIATFERFNQLSAGSATAYTYQSAVHIRRAIAEVPAGVSLATIEVSQYREDAFTQSGRTPIPIDAIVGVLRMYMGAAQPTATTAFTAPGTEIATANYPSSGNLKISGIGVTAGEWLVIAVTGLAPTICPFDATPGLRFQQIMHYLASYYIDIGYR